MLAVVGQTEKRYERYNIPVARSIDLGLSQQCCSVFYFSFFIFHYKLCRCIFAGYTSQLHLLPSLHHYHGTYRRTVPIIEAFLLIADSLFTAYCSEANCLKSECKSRYLLFVLQRQQFCVSILLCWRYICAISYLLSPQNKAKRSLCSTLSNNLGVSLCRANDICSSIIK